MNSLSFSWIHYEFTIFSQIHYLFGEVTMNKLSFSQIHYEFTIFFANSLWINYLFRKFTIYLAKLLWIHYLFREFTMNSLSFSRIHYEFTMNLLSFDRNRIICILCVFGRVSDLWPQNDPFWPLRWPRPTLRCTPLNLKQNLRSIHMYIMCIWPCFRFLTSKWPFWPLRWP